jgi:hypothetical protein
LTFTNATSRLQIACRERHGPPHVTNQGPLHLLVGLPPVGFHREGEPRTSCLLIRTPEGRSGTLLVALAGGTLILAGFGVVGFFVFAYSWYTRVGSGINQHPYGDVDHNSGRETPSELAHDITQDVRNWDRGVAGHHRHRHPPGAHS